MVELHQTGWPRTWAGPLFFFFFAALIQMLVDGVLASVSGNVFCLLSTPFWDGFHHGACLKGFRLSPTSAEAWNYCRDE